MRYSTLIAGRSDGNSMAALASIPLSLNTVQLVDEDCAFWRLLGLRMVLVVAAFGRPFENFAFDHARVGAEPACGVDSALQCCGGMRPQTGDRIVVMRRKKRCATVIFG